MEYQLRKIPRKLKIGFAHYSVVRSTATMRASQARKIIEDEELLGLADFDNQQLFIKSGLAHENERETLLHEALHIVFFNAGLNQVAGTAKEERIVNAFSQGVAQLLKDNPSFVDYLLEKA